MTRERYSDHVHSGEVLDILEASGTPACLINVHYQSVTFNDEMRKMLQLDQVYLSFCEWLSLIRTSNRPEIHQLIHQTPKEKEKSLTIHLKIANDYHMFMCKMINLENDQKVLIFSNAQSTVNGSLPYKRDEDPLPSNHSYLHSNTSAKQSQPAIHKLDLISDSFTDHKRSSKEELFTQVADHFPHGLAMINNNWEVIYANDKMEQLTGLSYHENSQKKLWDVISVEEYASFFQRCLRAMDTQEMIEVEGDILDQTVKMTILPTAQGLTLIGQDITLNKQQLQALQASEKRFSILANNINDVFWICDLDFQKVHYISPAFNKMFGMKRRELLTGWSVLKNLIHMNDYNKVTSAFSIMKQQKHHVEYRITTRAGEEKWIRTQGFPVINEGAEYVIGTHQDITKFKEIAQLKEKSQQLSTITQMAAGVAHEIKNPLTAIKGFLQIGAANPDLRDNYYEIILDEVNRIESIVQDFMMLSKPKSSIQLEDIDIEDVVSYVLRLLDPEATSKNINLSFTCNIVENTFQSEPKRLKQILLNIISNAIDATDKGGNVEVSAYTRGDNLILSIIDDGHGLSDQDLAKLGEPFFTTKEKGTGLGVMVTKKMVNDLNGMIAYKSELHQGTSVTVSLPYDL